jgi:hypothetical protein
MHIYSMCCFQKIKFIINYELWYLFVVFKKWSSELRINLRFRGIWEAKLTICGRSLWSSLFLSLSLCILLSQTYIYTWLKFHQIHINTYACSHPPPNTHTQKRACTYTHAPLPCPPNTHTVSRCVEVIATPIGHFFCGMDTKVSTLTT